MGLLSLDNFCAHGENIIEKRDAIEDGKDVFMLSVAVVDGELCFSRAWTIMKTAFQRTASKN